MERQQFEIDPPKLHSKEQTPPVYDLPEMEERDAAVVQAVAAQALPSRELGVEEVVRRLRDTEAAGGSGPVIPFGMLATPLFAIALLSCVASGAMAWVLACLLGLAATLTLMRQANLLNMERTALRNSQREKPWMAALTEALDWPDPRVKHIAGRLLTQFLPRMRDSDAYLFNRKRLNCLYRRLSPHSARLNPELTMAILQALPHISTDRALPYVARLASRSAFTPNGVRIRDTARAMLPLVEQRAADQRAVEEAERAAAAIAAGGETAHSEADLAEMAAINARVDAQIEEFEADLRKVRSPGMRIGFLFASYGIIVPYTVMVSVYSFVAGDWPLGTLFGVMALLCTQLYRFTLTDKHKILAQKLGEMDDVRCIGRLAELLDWPDEDVRAIAIAALQRLLPRAKASDRVLRTPGQRASLYRMLTLAYAEPYTEFQITLLKSLEQIGDASAVSHVEALAIALPSSARQRKVCDAASDCLPYLLTRSEKNRSSETLLRASSATATGAEMLVRPASAADVTPQEELLRASTGE